MSRMWALLDVLSWNWTTVELAASMPVHWVLQSRNVLPHLQHWYICKNPTFYKLSLCGIALGRRMIDFRKSVSNVDIPRRPVFKLDNSCLKPARVYMLVHWVLKSHDAWPHLQHIGSCVLSVSTNRSQNQTVSFGMRQSVPCWVLSCISGFHCCVETALLPQMHPYLQASL